MLALRRALVPLLAVLSVVALGPVSQASHERESIHDLSITQTDTPDPVTEGGFVTYTVRVANAGPHPAQSLSVERLLSGGDPVSASGHRWECSTLLARTTCLLHGALPAGGVAPPLTIIGRAQVDGASEMSSRATVTARGNETAPADNTSLATTTVVPGTDLKLDQVDEPDPVTAGHYVHYIVTVSNLGDQPATGVSLQHAASAGQVGSASGEGWTCSTTASSATCTLDAPLAAGSAAEVVDIVVLTPASSTPSTMQGVATVSSVTGDTDATNNTDSETTTVSGLGGDSATGYIPPEGGCITTNPLGCPENAAGPAALDAPATPSGATPANPTYGDAIFGAGPGGIASLFEGPQLTVCAVADCAGAAVDVVVPPGYDDADNPILVHVVYDASLAPASEDPRTVYMEKPVGGVPVITVLPDCRILGIANPSPCVDARERFDGDLRIRILMLSQDPRYQG